MATDLRSLGAAMHRLGSDAPEMQLWAAATRYYERATEGAGRKVHLPPRWRGLRRAMLTSVRPALDVAEARRPVWALSVEPEFECRPPARQ